MGSDLAVLWAVSNNDYFLLIAQSEATPKRVYERPHSELL